MEVCFIVLSGGSGTRLWPLSRKNMPKQFLRLSDGKTLLEKTVERLLPLVSGKSRLGVVAPPCYLPHTSGLLSRGVDIFIREPEARNTAGAMLFSCARLLESCLCGCHDDTIVVFVPSDHVVEDDEGFRDAIRRAVICAQNSDSIVLVGVEPSSACVRYGYVKTVKPEKEIGALLVKGFYEKPSNVVAQKLIDDGEVYWNTGIYVAKVSVIAKTAQEKAPKLWDSVINVITGSGDYKDVSSVSFDYAIAEKADNLMLVPSSIGWSDVGNISSFLSSMGGENCGTTTLNFSSEGTLAYAGNKTVVFCGVKDICLVETQDVTLIVHKNSVESIKEVVNTIKNRDKTVHLA